MKTNIFLNSYQQAENKLTYNFLSILELINSKSLMESLFPLQLKDNPIQNVRTVYGGGESNPDGSFELKKENGDIITVYFENKTKRRGLSTGQIELHINWLKQDDLLLVVTPRKSDIDLIRGLGNVNIIFFTWTEIANQLKKIDNSIISQFLEYGKLSGEFEELGELHKTDINIFCDYSKINFEKKLNNILNNFHFEIDVEKYGFSIPKRMSTDWGRQGTEFIYGDYELEDNAINSYGQFWTIAYYFDPSDHGIPFKNDQPEICFFFDIIPSEKIRLQKDADFIKILNELKSLGFESNLNEEISPNQWRLFFYRTPISEFNEISVTSLLHFTDEVFTKLLSVDLINHPYFKELLKMPTANKSV